MLDGRNGHASRELSARAGAVNASAEHRISIAHRTCPVQRRDGDEANRIRRCVDSARSVDRCRAKNYQLGPCKLLGAAR